MSYNFIVYGDSEALNGEPLILDISRCVREYTDQEIKEKYSELTETNIHEIKRFPCIFAYEDNCAQDPKFGLMFYISALDVLMFYFAAKQSISLYSKN